MSTPTIHRIADRALEFPCWAWNGRSGFWCPLTGDALDHTFYRRFTHWTAYTPDRPTVTPEHELTQLSTFNEPSKELREAIRRRVAAPQPAVSQAAREAAEACLLDQTGCVHEPDAVSFTSIIQRAIDDATAELRKQLLNDAAAREESIVQSQVEVLAAKDREISRMCVRVHTGENSENCPFCLNNPQSPGVPNPQCHLCELEADRDQLRAEVERLTEQLRIIGDMAVSDWDDKTVGAIDAALKDYPFDQRKYAERVRSLYDLARRATQAEAEADKLAVELNHCKAQLKLSGYKHSSSMMVRLDAALASHDARKKGATT